MSKSLLYAANTAAQELAEGDVVSFGPLVRRYGCNLGLYGGSVSEKGAGYYTHAASFNLTGTAAGAVTITMKKNGQAIPGAYASVTVAAGDLYQVTIPFVTRESCCLEGIISAEISGVNVTVSSASIWSERA